MSRTLPKIAPDCVGIAASGISRSQSRHNIRTSERRDWPVYGGSPEDTAIPPWRRSIARTSRSSKWPGAFDTGEAGGLQTSPIIVDGVLYAYTPTQKVIALDAATGKLLWKFDPAWGRQPARGLASWTDGKHRRILAGIMNYVYALDAATGKPIPSFGENGRIDLRENLGRDRSAIHRADQPGSGLQGPADRRRPRTGNVARAPGDIRAYDVRTGKLRWSFHTIPHPGEFGYETWPQDAWKYSGAANNWAGMAVDQKRGIVYVPTGSAALDFYGARSAGRRSVCQLPDRARRRNRQENLAFQGVRHDMWDRDFPSPPVLVTVDRDGKAVDAVAQTTKQGYVYLFDRSNGQPLFPIEYRQYPPATCREKSRPPRSRCPRSLRPSRASSSPKTW